METRFADCHLRKLLVSSATLRFLNLSYPWHLPGPTSPSISCFQQTVGSFLGQVNAGQAAKGVGFLASETQHTREQMRSDTGTRKKPCHFVVWRRGIVGDASS